MTTVADQRWPDEAALVSAVRAGDVTAFRAVVDALHGPLVRLAGVYVDPATADEVVQDTWVAVVEAIDGFEGRSSLKTWIFRIMLNKVRTRARREARSIPFAAVGREADRQPAVAPDRLVHPELGRGYWPAAPAPWHTLPDERLLSIEVTKLVAEAIEQLPPAQREVVVLRDVEGWESDEVCEALGISSVNQRVLLHRGRAKVRAALEEYFDE